MEGVNYPLPLRIFLTLLIEGLVLMSRTGRYHLIKPQAPVFVGPIYKYLKFCVSNSMPAVTASPPQAGRKSDENDLLESLMRLWGSRECPSSLCDLLWDFFFEICSKLNFFQVVFNCRIIALQYYVGFCHTSVEISHRYTRVTLPFWTSFPPSLGPPGGSEGKESACSVGDLGLILGLGRSPGKGNCNLLQYSCLENLKGQRSLVGYSTWGHKELDTTERLHFLSFPSPTPSWPSRLSQSPGVWVPCTAQQIPTDYLFHIWQCICFSGALTICSILLTPLLWDFIILITEGQHYILMGNEHLCEDLRS